MSKRVSTRPRRTRVYDANYNIGQSYYKPALDQLDRKYHGRPDTSEFTASPRLRFNIDDTYDDELQSARSRASRAITEDSVFDSRGGITSRGIPISSAFVDDDLDEDASLSRIRANRPKISSLINDLDLEDSFSKVRRRGNLDLSEKLMGIAGEDNLGTSIRNRALKMVSRTANVEEPAAVSSRSVVSSYKRTAITSDNASESVNSAATMRAMASKGRLAEIESEMTERSDKMFQREQRAANLKKLLADNDIEEVKSIKKVTF